MKKIVAILVVALGLSTTTQAQKGKKADFEKLTTEQKTELAVKKMTLKLDLTPSQASQVKPLIAQQVLDRKKMHEKRKSMKESGKKLSADERYAMKSAKLDKMIAFKGEMKRILNEKQYEKFEKMAARKAHKMKKRNRGKHKKRNKREQRS